MKAIENQISDYFPLCSPILLQALKQKGSTSLSNTFLRNISRIINCHFKNN